MSFVKLQGQGDGLTQGPGLPPPGPALPTPGHHASLLTGVLPVLLTLPHQTPHSSQRVFHKTENRPGHSPALTETFQRLPAAIPISPSQRRPQTGRALHPRPWHLRPLSRAHCPPTSTSVLLLLTQPSGLHSDSSRRPFLTQIQVGCPPDLLSEPSHFPNACLLGYFSVNSGAAEAMPVVFAALFPELHGG